MQKQGGDAKLPPLGHVLEKIVLMNTFVISYARGLVLKLFSVCNNFYLSHKS